MKKIFPLQESNKKPERTLEAIKHEVRKYMKRERKKKLPEGATYWDFTCQFGQESATAQSCTVNDIIIHLDKAFEQAWPSCYIEILAKAVTKAKADTHTPDQ